MKQLNLYYINSGEQIPDGKTVTPTDDVSIWLKCGQRSENYTTLAEVLADSTCLSALMADNNAVDYLVRSTTFASGITADSTAMSYIGLNNYCANTLLADSDWCLAICNSTYFESVLNVKVPTMTSNTTPSGVCSGSSKYTGRDYYQAFDGSSATYWYATDSNIPAYIQYQFTSAVKVKYVVFDVSGGNDPSQARVKDYDIKADGVVVYSGTHQTTSITEKAYLYNNETSATAWQVYVKNMWGGARIGLNQLQFYGRADV